MLYTTEDIQLMEPLVLRVHIIVGGWRMWGASMITESVGGDKRCRCVSDVADVWVIKLCASADNNATLV
jgi:hypothetical protein